MRAPLEVALLLNEPHRFDPTWMETKYIVVTSLDDTLNLHLYDYHEHRRHSYLGGAVFNLAKLREDVAPGGIHLPLVRNEKTRGELLVDVIFYPTVEPSDGRAGGRSITTHDGLSNEFYA